MSFPTQKGCHVLKGEHQDLSKDDAELGCAHAVDQPGVALSQRNLQVLVEKKRHCRLEENFARSTLPLAFVTVAQTEIACFLVNLAFSRVGLMLTLHHNQLQLRGSCWITSSPHALISWPGAVIFCSPLNLYEEWSQK